MPFRSCRALQIFEMRVFGLKLKSRKFDSGSRDHRPSVTGGDLFEKRLSEAKHVCDA